MTKRPIIGISVSIEPAADRRFCRYKEIQYTEQSLPQAIANAGGLPVMLPVLDDAALAAELAERIDALVLSGGADLDPSNYGETPLNEAWGGQLRRDASELACLRAMRAAGKPVLGLCRGMQLLNVALGGSLYQDIETQCREAWVHRDQFLYNRLVHPVRVDLSTWPGQLFGQEVIQVNSVHHQGIKQLAPDLAVFASADDGTIEAVYVPADRFTVGVQWHPEWMQTHAEQRSVFLALVRAALTP